MKDKKSFYLFRALFSRSCARDAAGMMSSGGALLYPLSFCAIRVPQSGSQSREKKPEARNGGSLLMLQRGKIQRTPPEKHGFSDVLSVRSIKVGCAWKQAANANVHTQTVKLTDGIRLTEWGQDPVWDGRHYGETLKNLTLATPEVNSSA